MRRRLVPLILCAVLAVGGALAALRAHRDRPGVRVRLVHAGRPAVGTPGMYALDAVLIAADGTRSRPASADPPAASATFRGPPGPYTLEVELVRGSARPLVTERPVAVVLASPPPEVVVVLEERIDVYLASARPTVERDERVSTASPVAIGWSRVFSADRYRWRVTPAGGGADAASGELVGPREWSRRLIEDPIEVALPPGRYEARVEGWRGAERVARSRPRPFDVLSLERP